MVGRLFGRDPQLENFIVHRFVGRVLEIEPLVGEVPHVLVLGVVGLAGNLQRDVMRFGVRNFILPAFEVPDPPRRDDRHVGGECLDGQLKPDLVVALSGAAVADGVGALCLGDLDDPLGDQRPCEGGSQQIFAFIDRPRLDGRYDEILGEFIGKVFDIELRCAGLEGFFLKPVEFRALADVGGYGDDLAAVVFLEPGDDHRGVKPAGICQNNFFKLCHENALPNLSDSY